MPVPATYFRCPDCDELLTPVEVHGGEDREPVVEFRCLPCGSEEAGPDNLARYPIEVAA